MDQEKLKIDNANLASTIREKARKHQQTQELYDRLKRKEMTAATQSAAHETVDEVLYSVNKAQGDTHLRRGPYPAGDQSADHFGPHRRAGSHSSSDRGRMLPPPQRPLGRTGHPTFVNRGYGNRERGSG